MSSTSPSDILLDATPKSPTAPHTWPPEHEDTKSRAPEFYGFVAWTSTYLAFVLYLLWGLLPDEWIVWTGVTWYPNREWAILIPSWTVVLVITTYIVYSSIAIRATPAFDEMNSLTDARISVPSRTDSGENPYISALEPNAIPELYDMPIGMVNRVLYRNDKDRSSKT
ncbi:hypothetical protein CVT24_001208 [Panaeolus cyanescens]|uniref:PIG-P domain-containing protein n=1 Tax=Panaeolus cyanescens TaxID=181874 RepID=A0A409VTS3_9AGAR|nr:hypothetical protein CVT24_001208 [Panaeolus cyanescens]